MIGASVLVIKADFKNKVPLEGVGGCLSQREDKSIQIPTKSGIIIPQTVQLEGKKPLTIEEFIKGKPDFINAKLG